MTHGKNVTEEGFELLRKTSETFASIKGTQIHLFLDPNNSYIGKRSEGIGYRIAVADSNDGVKHITFLEHELAHMMFDSPVLTLERCLGKIIANAPDKNPEWKMSDSQYKNHLKNIAMQCFNIIEDERIETNWGTIYEGTARQFLKAKEIYGGKNCKQTEDDPSSALFNARMNRVDLIGSEFDHIKKTYIDAVRKTAKGAGLVLAKKFFEDEMIPWLKDLASEPKPKPRGGEGKGTPNPKGKGTSKEDPKKKTDEPGGKPSDGEGEPSDEPPTGEGEGNPSGESEPTDEEPTGAGKLRKSDDPTRGGGHSDFKEEDPADDIDDPADLEDYLKKSAEEQEEKTKDIKESIEDFEEPLQTGKTLYPLQKTSIVTVKRPSGKINTDFILSRALNNLFKAIQGKYHDTIDISGGDIDTDELLQARLRKDGDFFLDEVATHGVSIAIGIDCSGSMGDDNMQQARDFCGTLYSALDGIANVDLKVVAWSSPDNQYKLSVTEITKYSECATVAIAPGHCHNANHMAHQYLEQMIRKSKAETKLIMMLTDGVPMCETGKHDVDRQDLVDLTTKAVNQTRQHGVRVLGLYVGHSSYDLKQMKEMYGQDFINVSDMTEARKEIIGGFKKYVIGAMRSN